MRKILFAAAVGLLTLTACDPTTSGSDSGVDAGSAGGGTAGGGSGGGSGGGGGGESTDGGDGGGSGGGTGGGSGGGTGGGDAMLADLPPCTSVEISATTVWDQVIFPNCGTSCHSSASSAKWSATSASNFITATVGVTAHQLSTMKVIEPNNIHKSYMMWKLMGQSGTVGGSKTTSMPKDKARLSDGDICKVMNWINSGAD